MKTLMQIAIECNTRYNAVKDAVRRERIMTTKKNGKVYLDKYQEEYIHQILYFEGKITELTLESKMNYE